ncbi:caspase-14-like [Amphiura filiformis]|uniref:caspase-14-like n=1 Tax=Amphiura filiformis TaxID=82378 RepID=UPI003B2221B3
MATTDMKPDQHGYYIHLKFKQTPELDDRRKKRYYSSLLQSKKKGKAYILNVMGDEQDRIRPREGSEVDFQNMIHLFTELGYDIEAYRDLTAKKINDTIDQFVSKLDPEVASSVVVLMSHGNEDRIYGEDGQYVNTGTVVNKFMANNCEALKDKPKLFFIQTCRINTGIKLGGRIVADSVKVRPNKTSMFNAADIYIANATCERYEALRDTDTGSWFVQAIVEEFFAGAHEYTLGRLMNEAINRVNGYAHLRRQQITTTITVRNDVYFYPKRPKRNLKGYRGVASGGTGWPGWTESMGIVYD